MIIKNFLFHRVSDETDIFWQPMRPETFEKIIAFLTKTHQIISLEKFLSNPNEFKNDNRKKATILFDDGFKDNIEFAAPILQKHKCPASFYVVTNCIDSGLPTWTYLVDYVLQNADDTRIELSFDYVPPELRIIRLGNISNEMAVVKKIKPWLKSLSDAKRNETIQCMIDQCKETAMPENKMMSWKDVRQLKQEGFSIGSHTHTHPLLNRLSNDEIDYELKKSAERISNETGIKPQTISYPNGSYDERVIRSAEKNGYKWGLAVEQKFFKYDPKKLMAIPRLQLWEEPLWKTKFKINGIHHRLMHLWS